MYIFFCSFFNCQRRIFGNQFFPFLSWWNFFFDYNVLINQIEEGSRAENLQVQRCRARLDHLESAGTDDMSEWNNMRLKRILVDYMLRMSYYESAAKLAETSNIQVSCFVLLLLEFVSVLYIDYCNFSMSKSQVRPSYIIYSETLKRLPRKVTSWP